MTEELTATFRSSVDAGTARLERHWAGLLATGIVGGIDVGVGVYGLFVVTIPPTTRWWDRRLSPPASSP